MSERHQPRSVTVAVTEDGSLAAVARSSGGSSKRYSRVDLWDTQTGELQRTITGFDGPIWSMTFSKDARSLITVSTEYRDSKIQGSVKNRNEKIFAELKWWNVETGEFVRKVPLAEEGVTSVQATWSPDGNAIAVIERYARRQLTQLGIPGAINTPLPFPTFEMVQEVDLKLLDAETGERRVKVDDVDKSFFGRAVWIFGRLEDPVFSPDGKTMAAIFGEDVVVWNVETGKKVRTLKKFSGWPSTIAFSPDNRFLAVASIKGAMPGGESEISVWEIATGKSVHRLRGKNDVIECLQFVVRGEAILIGSLQYEPAVTMGTVKLWDLRDNTLKRADIHEGKGVSSMTLIHDQTAVLVQSGPEVEVRDARTWQVIHSFESSEEDNSEEMRRSRFILTAKQAVAVAFSRDGTTVSAEIPGEGIRRWDARTGGVRAQIPRAKTADDAVLAFSSDGDFVVETTAAGVRLRDLLNGTTKQIPVKTDEPISAVALSPDNRTLITADESGLVQVWDAQTGESRKTVPTGQQITALAIDASGQLLATARADRTIVLWDLKTLAVRGEFRKHDDVVNALAFSPDGHTLASGGDDRTAILWDLASGRSKRTLKGHDLTVTSLAFSPDGLTLASGSGNASVVLWNVTTGKLDRILR
ncbi:MAG TPA: WD40 repeat domain-containing protein [Pyrinomonadaceae bacterium]|nr:WD40 repeat domain-containing protein [Pyrinomonadaceae bacterium]